MYDDFISCFKKSPVGNQKSRTFRVVCGEFCGDKKGIIFNPLSDKKCVGH